MERPRLICLRATMHGSLPGVRLLLPGAPADAAQHGATRSARPYGEGDAGPHPDHGRRLDAEPGGDLVGGAEADAADVAGQAVEALADHLDRLRAIGLVDPHRP